VLTLRSSYRPLRTQVDDLLASFRRLRRRKWWRDRVAGGAWTFELTWNAEESQWHPHLHTLVHAGWMQLQELSAEWHKASRGSHRVHVSLIEQAAPAIREVTKYVGKITHRSWERSHDLVVCVMKALAGRRLANTFGTWRGVELDAAAEPDPKECWEVWGSIDKLYELALARDPAALQILAALHGANPKKARAGVCTESCRAPPCPTPESDHTR
jgi:hypothetical protein